MFCDDLIIMTRVTIHRSFGVGVAALCINFSLVILSLQNPIWRYKVLELLEISLQSSDILDFELNELPN